MRRLVLVVLMLFASNPAIAAPNIPCVQLVGDFWGETTPPDSVKTLNGGDFSDPDALARAVGDGAVINGGKFAEWDFRAVRLANACFVDADLTGSVWTRADAPGVGFIRSDLSHASLAGIRAPGILLRDANLTGTHAVGADLSGGLFEGGWFDGGIDGWNIDGATLTDFTFSCGITLSDGCPLFNNEQGISARGTNFTRARLDSLLRYGFDGIDLEGAILDRTELSPGQLPSLSTIALTAPLVLVGGDERVQVSASEASSLIQDAQTHANDHSGPSFDCAKATSAVEELLCSPDGGDLALADRELAGLYAAVRPNNPAVTPRQRAWLKARDACMADTYPADCLRSAYSARIGVLLGMAGERNWLGRGETALFIDDELPLSDAMRSSALFARIAPVLASASMSSVVVMRGVDGEYTVSGESVGANAHTCSLSADAMRLDPATGWYSVKQPSPQAPARVLRIVGDRLEVFGNGRPGGDLPEAAMDYASCGARAAFGVLRRIDLPASQLEKFVRRATAEY